MEKNCAKGFTLIEVLLVIAILAILAAVVIVAINPAKQFGEAQNAQRRSDVRSILDAIHQYSIDNYGSLPSEEIPSGSDCATEGAEICLPNISCTGVSLDELLVEEKYLTDLPTDPSSATDVGTGYYVFQNGNGRIGVCAPTSYGDIDISVVR
jgi:type IV pilus assembly protein PilA